MEGQNRHSRKSKLRRARKLWADAAKRRRIRHFRALPKRIQSELETLRRYILSLDPAAQIKLTGSWTKGTWADEYTDADFRRKRLEIKSKLGLSDIDLVVDSTYSFSREELQALVASKLDLWQLPARHVNGIMITPGRPETRKVKLGKKSG